MERLSLKLLMLTRVDCTLCNVVVYRYHTVGHVAGWHFGPPGSLSTHCQPLSFYDYFLSVALVTCATS